MLSSYISSINCHHPHQNHARSIPAALAGTSLNYPISDVRNSTLTQRFITIHVEKVPKFFDDVGRMKRNASGDNDSIGSDAGSASLDPAYGKYMPNRFPAGSRNLSLFSCTHQISLLPHSSETSRPNLRANSCICHFSPSNNEEALVIFYIGLISLCQAC